MVDQIQTPEGNNSVAHAASGNLAFLLSVIRCGESLSTDEESNVREVIKRLGRADVAAKLFIQKLETVHDDPRYRRVWEIAQAHQGPYDGPKYEQELGELKEAMG